MLSRAASAAPKSSKEAKPKPLDAPVSGSLMIRVEITTPKALNVSYNSFSSTSGSKFPINRFAPTYTTYDLQIIVAQFSKVCVATQQPALRSIELCKDFQTYKTRSVKN